MSILKDQQDAFGHAMYDYFQNREGYEIIERDDGQIVPGTGPGSYFKGFDDWLPCERQATEFVRGKVLDIGCGAGRVALYLQEQGFEVTGIDNSPLAVETCRLRGVSDARLLPITQVSRSLGVFDTIMMYGNNFGLVGDLRRARWLLGRFDRAISGTGRIIAQSRDPYITDDPVHLAYHQLNRDRGKPAGLIKLKVRYKKFATPWIELLLLSQEEMLGLLEGTGWRVNQFFSDQDGIYIAILDKCD